MEFPHTLNSLFGSLFVTQNYPNIIHIFESYIETREIAVKLYREKTDN